MRTKIELWAVPNDVVRQVCGKTARPYKLRTKSVKAAKELLKFRHGHSVAGIQKLNAVTGEQIAYYPI